MRVVAGTARGLRLEAPAGDQVRPTPDRVREATFNALNSLDAIDEARVLDLFAGSGALGIEALSRGARSCTFCDTSAAALASVRSNLEHTGFTDSATVVRVDAATHLAATPGEYDLVLADPPYSFDGWTELLEAVDAPLVVMESGDEPAIPSGWNLVRKRRYGTTVVTIVERCNTS
jgi:16S rRNA (guanine966-N2)-methyltransferase